MGGGTNSGAPCDSSPERPRSCHSSLSQNGGLILDDSEREEYQNGVIHLKQLGYNELDFWGIAPGIFYNKCTSIFYRDNNCLGI